MAKASKQRKTHGFRGFVLGGIVGAATGASYSLCETLVRVVLGLGPAEGVGVWSAALACAIVGGATGAAFGTIGYRNGAWRLAHAIAFTCWMGSGLLYTHLPLVGLAGLAATACLLLTALFTGALVGRLPMAEERSRALGLHLLFASAVLMPVLIHLYPPIPHWLAVGAVCAVLLLTFPVAVLVGRAAAKAPPMLTSVAVGAVTYGLLFAWTHYGASGAPRLSASDAPPIVIIAVEGLRADALTDPEYRQATKNLRRFQAGSRRYTSAFATSGVTSAAMASILTGVSATAHGVGLRDPKTGLTLDMPSHVPTLYERLAAGGYRTSAFVSGGMLERGGMARGFDHWNAYGQEGAAPAVAHLWSQITPQSTRWPARRPVEDTIDAAVAHVDRNANLRGHALFVHLDALQPPFRYRLEDQADLGALPKGAKGSYMATARRVDHAVHRLVQVLPRDGVVVIMGVSGVELDEARSNRVGPPAAARSGHTLHNELLHVPMMVRDGRVGPIDTVLSSGVIASVVLEATGLPVPDDLMSETTRTSRDAGARVAVSTGVRWGAELRVAQTRDHKLVEDQHGRWALYDLQEDPAERRAIAEGGPVVDRVRAALGRHTANIELPARAQRERQVLPDALQAMTRLWSPHRGFGLDDNQPKSGS